MKNIVILLLVLFVVPLNGQTIKRRASLGFRPVVVDKATAEAAGLKEEKGVVVSNILPGGTMDQLGTKEQDILIAMNGVAVNSFQELLTARDKIRGGDYITALVWRNEKEIKLKGQAVPIPFEQSEYSEVIYDQFDYKGGQIRTIINKPLNAGRHPAIFFIPGYTCSSIDRLGTIHPYRQLLDSFVALGYAVFRMEKPGVGDNTNTGDCFQLGFDNEMEAYKKGFKELEKYDFIDTDQVFFWGHSMGGIYAPILASELQPRGVAVYGIIHDTWTEYLLRMIRYQNPRLGSVDFIQTDRDVRILYALLYEHYHLGKSSKELYNNPVYKEILERDFAFDGNNQILNRHEDFWREIYKYNLSEAWANFAGHVLSMNGEADLEVINSFSQREIVKIVNHYHPGKGTFEYFPKTDHSMIKVGTLEEGARLRSQPEYRRYVAEQFNFDIVTKTDEWIKAILEEKTENQ